MDEVDLEPAPGRDDDRHAVWIRRIEAALGIAPLSELSDGSRGATRLIECGEGSWAEILSCAWHPGGAWVESASGVADGWGGRREVEARWRAWLPAWLLPRRLRDWSRARASFATAPSCEGAELVLDGPYFYHGLFIAGRVAYVCWSGPTPGLHDRQWELVRAHRRVRRAGWLHSRLAGGRSRDT